MRPLNRPGNHFPNPKFDPVSPILTVLHYLATALVCRSESSVPWVFISPAELQAVSLNFYPSFPRLSELLLGPVFVHDFKVLPFFFINTVSLKEAIQIRTHLTKPPKLSSSPTVCWIPLHSPMHGQNKLFLCHWSLSCCSAFVTLVNIYLFVYHSFVFLDQP